MSLGDFSLSYPPLLARGRAEQALASRECSGLCAGPPWPGCQEQERQGLAWPGTRPEGWRKGQAPHFVHGTPLFLEEVS